MKAIFSRNQHFSHPLLGHTGLNKAGLHLFRLSLASACFNWRRLVHQRHEHRQALRQFNRDGFLLLADFLPAVEFDELQQQVRQKIAVNDKAQPIHNFNEHGFGQKHYFNGGFDRFDGTTLNRFYTIAEADKALFKLSHNQRLLSLLGSLAGMRVRPQQFQLYKVIHGAEAENPDIQKYWHRDTFQPALKMWYFTEAVSTEHGPFEFMPGSHRITAARLAWEHRQAVTAAQQKAGGSFRIDEPQLLKLYSGEPLQLCVPANSLVIADIRGFHRRGNAVPGMERVSLYANFRPHPFKLW